MREVPLSFKTATRPCGISAKATWSGVSTWSTRPLGRSSGRVRLRPNRGFPRCLAYSITPGKKLKIEEVGDFDRATWSGGFC